MFAQIIEYSHIIVIGDSYSDDGRIRAPEYISSFGFGAGGRYSNGPTQIEFLSKRSEQMPLAIQEVGTINGIPLASQDIDVINLAFGGAFISQEVEWFPLKRPSSGEQIDMLKEYLLSGAKVGFPSSRTLLFLSIGINSVSKVFWDALAQGFSEDAKVYAKIRIINESDELIKQLRELNNFLPLHIPNVDYMIQGIPMMSEIPAFQLWAYEQSITPELALKFLNEMTISFNNRLETFVKGDFKNQVQQNHVFFFSLYELWQDFFNKPEKYGLNEKKLLVPAYDDFGKLICDEPTKRLYYDSAHPTTTIHHLISKLMSRQIMGGDSKFSKRSHILFNRRGLKTFKKLRAATSDLLSRRRR